VLATGIARLALIIVALVLALAPWGLDSADVMSSLRGAFFGVTIGGVTISLASIAIACTAFAFVLVITRVIKRWLDATFLPATDLDAGLRNSISTAFGYLGLFVAAALGFSYLGLSLDKIAIVAGALSVGIGFGLQSIVNNFVSGLILLWERPIRVGDLIVVGDGEGHVRRISVRATEIETFDRSTIIVPNSSLISGTVRNRVRGNRAGRVIVTVNVLRNADPAQAADILMACARDHADVLKEPPPRVVFKKIGDPFLEFDLVCFVADVEFQTRVLSDLNFAVFRALGEAKLVPPLGPAAMDVKGLGGVETALDHIAEAIGAARPAGSAG
jgi:potassium efflux system protein